VVHVILHTRWAAAVPAVRRVVFVGMDGVVLVLLCLVLILQVLQHQRGADEFFAPLPRQICRLRTRGSCTCAHNLQTQTRERTNH
jgi:hypothetical protein